MEIDHVLDWFDSEYEAKVVPFISTGITSVFIYKRNVKTRSVVLDFFETGKPCVNFIDNTFENKIAVQYFDITINQKLKRRIMSWFDSKS